MKKILVSVAFIYVFVLAACNQNVLVNNEVESENEQLRATSTEEKEKVSEAMDEEISEETSDIPETNDDIEEVSPEIEAADESAVDASNILQQSFEAMADLESVHMNANVNVNETMDGEEVTEEKNIDMTLLLVEPYARHFTIEIESNMMESIISEVYEMEDSHFINSSVHNVEWGVIPNPLGTQQLSPLIENAQIEAHLSSSDQFEVTENEHDYLLSFNGTHEWVQSSLYGGVKVLLQEVAKEMPMELEEITSTYETVIDKETYYVKEYKIYYEAQVPEDQGEYLITNETVVTLDEYNEHNEIIVPQEVMDEAVSMVDNEGNAMIGN